jgi:hypothetical protein
MDPTLLERLAREAGFWSRDAEGPGDVPGVFLPREAGGDCRPALRRFAALVAEECARECDAQRFNTAELLSNPGQSSAARAAARAIRAKFGTHDPLAIMTTVLVAADPDTGTIKDFPPKEPT